MNDSPRWWSIVLLALAVAASSLAIPPLVRSWEPSPPTIAPAQR